jgi:hypothetical protein
VQLAEKTTPVWSCASEFVGQVPPLLLPPGLPELLPLPELLALPELPLPAPLPLPELLLPEPLPLPELVLPEESAPDTPPASADRVGLDDPQAMIPEARPA